MTEPKLTIPAGARFVLNRLQDASFEAYIVGGAVRDMLLHRSIQDIDIATNALPEEVMKLFPGAVGTGLHHGTVTVPAASGERFEVTTYRTDGPYLDGRHPEYVEFTRNLTDDLARRDFTINAMALSASLELVDPFGGQADLRNGILCAVGNPYRRFEEDGLRMLRGVRFVAGYGFQVEPRTLEAITKCGTRIQSVSLERVGQELMKLANGDWRHALPVIQATRLFSYLQRPICELQTGFASVYQRHEEFGECLPQGTGAFASWFVLSSVSVEAIQQMVRQMALGKDTARGISQLCCLTRNLLTNAPQALQPLSLYPFGARCLRDAIELASWFEPLHAPALDRAYHDALRTMPIWDDKELALTGREIIAHGVTGRAVGVLLRRLVYDVLTERVRNQEGALQEHLRNLLQDRQEKRYD